MANSCPRSGYVENVVPANAHACTRACMPAMKAIDLLEPGALFRGTLFADPASTDESTPPLKPSSTASLQDVTDNFFRRNIGSQADRLKPSAELGRRFGRVFRSCEGCAFH
jgi:hypothetical protein